MCKIRHFYHAMLFIAFLFGLVHGALYEEKCTDGTGYFQCSATYPGYACLPDNNTLTLQTTVGSVYPPEHPKAGQPTDMAVKCNCTHFAGFILSNGQCVNSSSLKAQMPPGATGANSNSQNANSNVQANSGSQTNSSSSANSSSASSNAGSSSNSGRQNNSSSAQNSSQQNGQGASDSSNPSGYNADVLPVPAATQTSAQTPSQNLGIIEAVAAFAAISFFGLVALIVVAAIVWYFILGRKRDSL